MSYENSNSAPSSDTRGRVEEREEAQSGGNSPNKNGGPPPTTTSEATSRGGRGSSPGGASGSGGDTDAQSSGNDSGENKSRGRQSNRSSHSSAMMLQGNKSSVSQSSAPTSSSLAYSLLSASSQRDPPSTSGCSSDQSARVKTQKELMKALRELKIRLPAERKGKSKGRSSTLDALKYALNCVKQVRANQEYYHQWSVEECQGCNLDLSAFTREELDCVTSEYTLKNTDTFSMAVSFLTGKVVYLSPQGSSLLRCKPEKLHGTVFSELLAPQDVSTFYSSTAPCRLPQWGSSCIGSASPPVDCAKERPIFCRVSADRAYGGEMRYYPFRMTPYQIALKDSDAGRLQPCCLLIAEKVHSGYEAPRISADKRVFTTSHTPSCLFQEVDERAVALLGYLPQDLVGTPVLLYLHPEDRPIMVAIHKKILQFAGQPFDHSPLRICARNGEYLTIDTSWSSFVNPWSRKVAFIVGRHKVRTSPLNEDVFNPPRGSEGRAMAPQVVQLSEQIHRLLVQPVHSQASSQGYSSLGSNVGSHEHHRSAGSSSDSNGPTAMEDANAAATAAGTPLHKPMTFQQICKNVHMVKTNGQQVFIESRNRPPPRRPSHTVGGGLHRVIDDPIRSLITEVVVPPKTSGEERGPTQLVRKEPPSAYSYQQINCLDSIVRYLESCNVPNTVKRKCGSSSSTSDEDKQQAAGTAKGPAVSLVHSKPESVDSVTSQCSFSSTIVHVGDKKKPEPAALIDIIMEEATPVTTALPPPTAIAPPPPPTPSVQPEREGRRGGAGGRFGLTKEVLSAHTQNEEQAFLCRFRDLSQLRVFDPASAMRSHPAAPTATNPLARGARCSRDYPAAGPHSGRRGPGGKRLKHQESSDPRGSLGLSGALRGPGGVGAAHNQPPPASTFPLTLPLPMPLGTATTTSSSWPASVASQASLPTSVAYPPGMLPLYPLYPPLSQPMPVPVADPSLAVAAAAGLRFPHMQGGPQMPPMMALVLPNYMFPQLNPSLPQMAVPSSPTMVVPHHPGPQNFYNPNAGFPFPGTAPAVMVPLPSAFPMLPPGGGPSRSSTPPSSGQPLADHEGAESTLFQSRCSSPLNLLQLEESPSNRLEVATALAAATQQATPPAQGSSANQKSESNQDAMSTSSDLLDLLLQEDSRSGTGSAASGSGLGSSSGSGSNGCSSSGSGTRSSNTSKYFGSIDSSENEHSRKQPAGGAGEEQFIKCVLQDPIWLLMANTDDKVMMTYQLPVRDIDAVLRKDREALRTMQRHQPRFSEDQKKELSLVHPWIRTGRVPRTINISGCMGCKSPPSVTPSNPFDVEIHEMELCSALGPAQKKAPLPDTPMEEDSVVAHAKTKGNDQEMATEELEEKAMIP